MSIATMLEPIAANSGAVTLPEAENWMQGRTLYGGASALVAYVAATRAFTDLPPLRAAQIGFVAPVGEEVELSASIERQGRNVTQVRSEIHAGGKLALTAFWLFGAAREANADYPAPKAEPWPGSPEDNELMKTDKAPSFLRNNFEIRRAQDQSGPGDPVVRRWFRLGEPSGLDPIAELVLLGDTLPPGSMRAMQRQGPISSINWSLNILDPEPDTRDGWWLGETAGEWAGDGFSSERLGLWNTDGRKVATGLQSVAVFG